MAVLIFCVLFFIYNFSKNKQPQSKSGYSNTRFSFMLLLILDSRYYSFKTFTWRIICVAVCVSISVTSTWPGRCNRPTNLQIIAAGLGICHRSTMAPQPHKINTLCPLGDPAIQGDVNTVD